MVVLCEPCEKYKNNHSSINARVIIPRTSQHIDHPFHKHLETKTKTETETESETAMVKPLPPRPRIKNVGVQTEVEFVGRYSYTNFPPNSFSTSLWSKRFTRWWGWTWLRKRARTLNRIAREAGIKRRETRPTIILTTRPIFKNPTTFNPVYNEINQKSQIAQTSIKYIPQTQINSSILTRNDGIKLNEKFRSKPFKNINEFNGEPIPSTSYDSTNYLTKNPVRTYRKRRAVSKERKSSEPNNVIAKSKCSLRKEVKRYRLEKEIAPKLNLNSQNYTLLEPIDINDKNYIPKPNFIYLNRLENIRKEQRAYLDQIKNDQLKYPNDQLNYPKNQHKITPGHSKSFNGSQKTGFFSKHLLFGRSKSQKITCDPYESKINDRSSNRRNHFGNGNDSGIKNYDPHYIENNLLSFSNQISGINNLCLK